MRKPGQEKASSQTLKAVMGVRELVYSGAFEPGDRLSEISVSDHLGLSRTPIRAALARLEQEGILEAIPSGGYGVRSFTESDVIDAIELRGVLEGTAARLAAERGVAPQRMATLQGLLTDLDRIVGVPPKDLDFDAYMSRNADFHDMLKTLSGSRIIAAEIERATRLPFSGPSAFLNIQSSVPAFRTSLTVGQAHHRAIATAIEMREGSRAEAIAREHARLARVNLEYIMENRHTLTHIPGLALVAG